MTRPAWKATLAGSKPESPSAIGSAFTYSSSRIVSRKKKGASVVFPAPLGPAITITAKSFWTAKKSWDLSQVPKPFTRVRVDIAPPIYVPHDADEAALEAKRDELQHALDEINQRGDEWRVAQR